jgi:hypothetical protein
MNLDGKQKTEKKNTEEAAYHSREASRHVNPEAAIAHSHLIVPSHHQ